MVMVSSRALFDQQLCERAAVTHLAGTDEAGRGAMAGPIVVAAVILPPNYDCPGINDSKKLTARQRERMYELIVRDAVSYRVEIVSPALVDTLNPKAASIMAMVAAVEGLAVIPNLVLVDGECLPATICPTRQLIRGDSLSQSVAAASIIAKVTRDRIMVDYDRIYPMYGFARHKGYCTLEHQARVRQHGVLPIHRHSYAPIRNVKL